MRVLVTLTLVTYGSLWSSSLPATAGSDGYYRQPALAADNIIFVSEGDLWKVPVKGGTATRAHEGFLGKRRKQGIRSRGRPNPGWCDRGPAAAVADADGGKVASISWRKNSFRGYLAVRPPGAVAVGDFDGDGKLDFVVTRPASTISLADSHFHDRCLSLKTGTARPSFWKTSVTCLKNS